jgi:hypothetical protein
MKSLKMHWPFVTPLLQRRALSKPFPSVKRVLALITSLAKVLMSSKNILGSLALILLHSLKSENGTSSLIPQNKKSKDSTGFASVVLQKKKKTVDSLWHVVQK